MSSISSNATSVSWHLCDDGFCGDIDTQVNRPSVIVNLVLIEIGFLSVRTSIFSRTNCQLL